MSWRLSATAARFAALALLAVVAISPLASADHAYSHRYIIFGHVVDAENNPVPGLGPFSPTYSSVFKPEAGGCSNQPGTGTDAWLTTATSPVTNSPYGEFTFCHHVHPLSRAEPGKMTLEVEGQEHTVEFDAFMRYSFVEIKLPAAHANANKVVNSQQHTIMGRVWESTGTKDHQVEGIRVFGDTLHNKDVNITFTYNGKEPVTLKTRTNNYGDFALRTNVTERPTSGTVTVSIEGHTFTQAVSETGVTFVRGQIGDTPKTNVPAPSVLLALALVGAVAVALRPRKHE